MKELWGNLQEILSVSTHFQRKIWGTYYYRKHYLVFRSYTIINKNVFPTSAGIHNFQNQVQNRKYISAYPR